MGEVEREPKLQPGSMLGCARNMSYVILGVSCLHPIVSTRWLVASVLRAAALTVQNIFIFCHLL